MPRDMGCPLAVCAASNHTLLAISTRAPTPSTRAVLRFNLTESSIYAKYHILNILQVKKNPTKEQTSDRSSEDKEQAQEETESPEKVQTDKSPGDKAHRTPEGKAKLHDGKPHGDKSPKVVGTKVSGEKAKESKASVGKSEAQGEKRDIYDRLTDPSTYHATHKHRFDSSGKGRGLEGRDASAKGAGMSPGSVKSQAAYVTGYKHEGTYGKAK